MKLQALGLSFLVLSFASPAFAAPIIIGINEGSNGIYDLNDKKGPQSLEGKMSIDPSTGKQAWSYALPAGITAADGDVLMQGGNLPGQIPDGNDLLRFNKNIIYVYSEAGPVELNSGMEPSGVALPPADVLTGMTLPANKPGATIKEDIRDDANSGAVYSPTATQPGFGKAAPNNNLFLFISDGDGGTAVNKARRIPDYPSAGKSVAYNASQQQLTFANDHITDTVFSDDPLLNAAVKAPTFKLVGFLANGTVLFQSASGGIFSIANGSDVFLQAHLPMLAYSIADNAFSGALTDLSFNTALGSPWIDRGADIYDPTSANFDSGRALIFSYTPDNNFLALTVSFSIDGESSGTDGIGDAPIPEPSTWLLLGSGLVGLILWRKRTA